jgi:PAS domain S-box-containing protein
MSKRSHIFKGLRIGLATLCATAVYEVVKDVCVPRISPVESELIAALIASCLGFCISLVFRQRGEASEERYRTLGASIPEVVWTVDKEGNVTFMSAQVEKILGYSMAELYRQGATVWFNAVHLDDRQRVKQAFESLFKERRPYDVECRAQRKNGEWFWAHDRAVATTDKNGVRIATGLLSDITAGKATEEALPKLDSIVEFSENAIIGKNIDDVIISWNQAAAKLYG